MESVLKRIDIDSENLYREVELLARIFNDDYLKNGTCQQLKGLTEDVYRHLVVKAFAISLGAPFAALSGSIMHTTRDKTRQGWPQTVTRYVFGGSDPIPSLTKEDEHSWLCVSEFDLWIDLLPPGSDVRNLSPVKYLPGPRRPGYTQGKILSENIPDTSRVLDLSKYFGRLSKQNDPRANQFALKGLHS